MTPTHRPPPLWPLALALAATLFLVRTEAQLILLAIALAALFYAAARTFAAGDSLARPGEARRDEARPAGPMNALDGAGLAQPDDPAARTMRRPVQLILFFPATRSALLAIATLIVLFGNVAFSTLPSTSLWFAWILGLFPLAYLLGITALARGAHPAGLQRATGALLTLLAVWGVIEWLRFGGRSNGPFLDLNAFGALFYLAVPGVFLALARARNRRARVALIAVLALMLWALFATVSRGAIGVLLLMLPPLLIGLRRAAMPWRAPAAILLVLTGLAWGTVRYLPDAPVTREVVNLAGDQSTQDRLAMWRSTLAMWCERPVTGQGLGSYKLHYLHHRTPDERSSSGDLAHNDYLQLLAEAGPLALAILILAGVCTLVLAGRLWQRMGPAHDRRRRGAALTGWVAVLPVLGLFVHATVNFIFYVAPLALLAGLLLARARHAAGPVPLRPVRLAAHPRLAGAAYAVAASLAVGAITLDWLASQAFDAQNRWPVFAERRTDPLARYQMATAFAALRPHHVATQQALTTSAIDLALTERNGPTGAIWAGLAVTHARHWLSAGRGNPYVYDAMGQLLWHFPSLAPHMAPDFPERPDDILALAVARDPANPSHRLRLAQFLADQGEPTHALETLLDALPWSRISMPPERVAAWQLLLREAMTLAEATGDRRWAADLARMVRRFDPENATAERLLTHSPDATAPVAEASMTAP